MRRLRRIPLVALAGGMMTGLALILATIALLSLGGFAHRNCESIELVKARIRLTLAENAATLGQPGSAGYAYYLAHPAELAQAHKLAQVSLGTFRPSPC